MKKYVLFLLTLVLTSTAFSQVVKKGASEVATIQTPTVQCEECKKKIESYVSREEGIQKVVVDYKKKITKVTYLTDRTNIENVRAAIATVGYDADDVPAEPSAYQKLPLCCKKTEDGGGHSTKN